PVILPIPDLRLPSGTVKSAGARRTGSFWSRCPASGSPCSCWRCEPRDLFRIQLAVPVQEVAPAFVEIVGWEGAAVLLQLPGGRLERLVHRMHARFTRRLV